MTLSKLLGHLEPYFSSNLEKNNSPKLFIMLCTLNDEMLSSHHFMCKCSGNLTIVVFITTTATPLLLSFFYYLLGFVNKALLSA